MIIKNGRTYFRLGVKSGTTKEDKIVIKNGRTFFTLAKSIIAAVVASDDDDSGYGQKVLSIAASNLGKVMGVAKSAIEKVIGT